MFEWPWRRFIRDTRPIQRIQEAGPDTLYISRVGFGIWLKEQAEKRRISVGDPQSPLWCPLATYERDHLGREIHFALNTCIQHNGASLEKSVLQLPQWAINFQYEAISNQDVARGISPETALICLGRS